MELSELNIPLVPTDPDNWIPWCPSCGDHTHTVLRRQPEHYDDEYYDAYWLFCSLHKEHWVYCCLTAFHDGRCEAWIQSREGTGLNMPGSLQFAREWIPKLTQEELETTLPDLLRVRDLYPTAFIGIKPKKGAQ